jgi:hypothetical protein
MASLAIDHSEDLGADVVGEILLIPVSQIERGERMRPIDTVWATALGQVMRREGQRTPIEVCRMPRAEVWTIVAGGHRHAAAQRADIAYLRAIVVSAADVDRRMGEVSENLWRRDLEPIDRAAFIAELVSLHKARAGIDPAKDGRAISANVRWQRAVTTEADDATETISIAYGWSDEIGAQLGFTGRTIRNDLMLFRRLAPSLVERLRAVRHPVATNATQLRALAKLDEPRQRQVVDLLLHPTMPTRNVGDALRTIEQRPAPDAEAKRLSAFIGAFQRMGLAEKKGALEQLRGLLPAGTNLSNIEQTRRFSPLHERYRDEALEAIDAARETIDGILEDEAVTGERAGDLERVGIGLAVTRLTIAGNGFELGVAA